MENSISSAEIITNTIIIAIVETIGPIAFSTNEENKKARARTTVMLKVANPYAKINLQKTSVREK
ncbi:MAG: hypothetical protein MZV64_20990 [Ignavibacteriales bacterium]|nr:hypothetical protein [Ignavibacteriales bacterium]